MSEKIQKRIAFGYNRGFSNKIEVNPIQAMVVKLLFEYYAEGLSMNAVSNRLES